MWILGLNGLIFLSLHPNNTFQVTGYKNYPFKGQDPHSNSPD